jgi:hypothetical protein
VIERQATALRLDFNHHVLAGTEWLWSSIPRRCNQQCHPPGGPLPFAYLAKPEASMRAMLSIAAVIPLLLLLPNVDASSQAKKGMTKPGMAAGESVHYTVISGEFIPDLPSDTVWRETRRGGKTVSAVLDVCYSPSPMSNGKERFVVPLRPENGKLVGSGKIEPSGTPVKVNLARRQADDTFSLEGTITRGSAVDEVEIGELTDMSEREYRVEQARDEEIVADPADFNEVVPIAIGVRVATDKVPELVKTLRGLNVEVDYDSLIATCTDLRTGEQLVRIGVDPERAPGLVKQLKAIPGVLAAGWTPGSYGIESVVRIPAAPWRAGGALKKDELAARISAAAAKELAATAETPEWDPITGEFVLRFKRPDAAARGLNLTELIEMSVLIGPDKPAGGDQLMVWLSDPTIETVDENAASQRLSIIGGSHGDDEDAAVDLEGVLDALVADLNGQRWDSESSTWK